MMTWKMFQSEENVIWLKMGGNGEIEEGEKRVVASQEEDGQEKFLTVHSSENWAVQMFGWQ